MNVAENIIKRNTENINTKDVDICPCGKRLIYEKYPQNPYRKLEVSEAGVIFGLEGTHKMVSDQTGEIEGIEEDIICAKVIAVGDDCKYVHIGDDIFIYNAFGKPLPFRKKGYMVVDEMNVLCIVKEKC